MLGVAARTLNRYGVSNASLPAVAEELGVSRAALYYYFADQEDLVFQSYRRSCEVLAGQLAQAMQSGGDAMAVIDHFVDGMLGENSVEIASLSDLAYLSEAHRADILGRLTDIKGQLAGILATGSAVGTLRPCATGIVAAAILGLVLWPPNAMIWRSSATLTHGDIVEGIKDLLRMGFAVDRRVVLDYAPLELKPPEMELNRIFDAHALAAAKRESLLAAASWLFNLKGVDATSLDEVAMRVGVTKKVIYHNLGDKETVVAECYRRSFRFYEDLARRIIAGASSRLGVFIASTATLAEANLREDIAPLAPLSGIEALPQAVQDEINRVSAWLMDTFLSVAEEGQREGSVRAMNARAVLAVLPGAYEWLPKWYDALSIEEREQAPRELARLQHVGLLAI